jgi:signal transduction histidine kinase
VALDLAADGDADAARDALAYIGTDFGDLDRLVEDILAAARLDLGAVAGGLPLRRDRVMLTDLVEAAATRFQVLYPKDRLELQCDVALDALEGDGALLRRVVDNLIDNARKYSEPNSPIVVRLDNDAGAIVLSVIDRGMGIEAKDLPHIFTPFFRTDRSRTRKTGGVGLGLTLVRRIVNAHGGRVDVESQVGVGTRVRVRLPVAGVGAAVKSEGHAHFRTRPADPQHERAS